MTNLVDETYFEQVIAEMNKKGFVLFSRVTTEQTDEVKYHVSVTQARDTRLFFHYPNTCLIVTLAYNEDACDWNEPSNSVEGHWDAVFDYEFLPVRELVMKTSIGVFEKVPRSEIREDTWGGEYRKVPHHNCGPDETLFPDFRYRTCKNMTQLYAPEERTSPEKIAENVWGFIGKTIPYLNKGPFSELQVTSFPPHYTFPRSESMFWEQFKAASATISTPYYLWSLVRRPWGSKGLKR